MAGWTRAVALAGAAVVLCVLPVVASAQGKQAWEEYDRLIESKRAVAALSADNVFGDSLDLYSGVLSFTATDVSIPGNSKLPVAVTRKFTVTNREGYTGYAHPFAEWELDIPHLSGVFQEAWHDNRCDVAVPPMGAGGLPADEFWSGNYADMPGGGEMLQATTTWPKPSTGGPYKWVTAGNTYFSCLSSIANGTGQGFLAIASDGTKYWFNHMARTREPDYKYQGVDYGHDWEGNPLGFTAARFKVALYVTRVEDRFGNWVTYSYSNTPTQALKITQITSNDSRTLTFGYNTSGLISTVSDGSHTWSYGYQGNSLSSVTLPDTSSWQLSFANLSNAVIQPSGDEARPYGCFQLDSVLADNFTGTITHPSGATGTYTVGPVRFGRTNVPAICRNYRSPGQPDPNGKSDDFFLLPVRAFSLTLKNRQISGPGITTGTWTYAWSGGLGTWQYPPGETEPVCTQSNCLDPVCTSDDCAGARSVTITEPDGSWTKHLYGNSYRYNEGKALSVETGKGSNALRTVLNDYNYATSGQAYSARIGVSPQPRGAGFVSEYPRPRVWTATLQDGADFIWEVDKTCAVPVAGSYCFDEFAQPTKITRTGTVAKTMPGTTLVLPPGTAPTLTAPATNATGSFTVSWTAVSGAATYQLQEQKNQGGWATLQNTSATSRSLSGKTDGSWSYQVRACNSAGCSGWSAIKTTEVAIPPSGVPTLTAPATNTSGSYTVGWTAVSLATRYELDERKNGGSWVNIVDAGIVSWAASAKGTGTYDYRVRACNGAGCAAYSAIDTTTVSSPLPAPTLTAPTTAQTYEPFTVSWTSVSTATNYVLQQNRNSTGWNDVYTGAGTSTARTINIAGTYQYQVQACNANGCSPYSAVKTVQVEGDTSLLVPEEPPPEVPADPGEGAP
ncbi:chitinase N-terminal domain-containing protein [Lysobacter sp. M2-1]|uniref:chitinase N-terminal domain-containing protein n=1 Tax=Lysobacter sp. M2-1 TaxID=2916839 RepID=UPI001F5A0E0A|nr:chitinase N-terminal domain-containing protein [Lysobacter sp. M2-1]